VELKSKKKGQAGGIQSVRQVRMQRGRRTPSKGLASGHSPLLLQLRKKMDKARYRR